MSNLDISLKNTVAQTTNFTLDNKNNKRQNSSVNFLTVLAWNLNTWLLLLTGIRLQIGPANTSDISYPCCPGSVWARISRSSNSITDVYNSLICAGAHRSKIGPESIWLDLPPHCYLLCHIYCPPLKVLSNHLSRYFVCTLNLILDERQRNRKTERDVRWCMWVLCKSDEQTVALIELIWGSVRCQWSA